MGAPGRRSRRYESHLRFHRYTDAMLLSDVWQPSASRRSLHSRTTSRMDLSSLLPSGAGARCHLGSALPAASSRPRCARRNLLLGSIVAPETGRTRNAKPIAVELVHHSSVIARRVAPYSHPARLRGVARPGASRSGLSFRHGDDFSLPVIDDRFVEVRPVHSVRINAAQHPT